MLLEHSPGDANTLSVNISRTDLRIIPGGYDPGGKQMVWHWLLGADGSMGLCIAIADDTRPTGGATIICKKKDLMPADKNTRHLPAESTGTLTPVTGRIPWDGLLPSWCTGSCFFRDSEIPRTEGIIEILSYHGDKSESDGCTLV